MLTSIVTTAPMFTCLFWVMMYLWGYRRNDTCRKIMFWFMLTAFILYFGHACYFQREYSILYVTDSLYCFANLAVYPIYYLYVRKLTTNRLELMSVILWLLPAVLVSVNTVIAYLYESEEVRDMFLKSYLYHESVGENNQVTWLVVIHIIARVIFAVEVVAVILLSFRKINGFNTRLKNFYSNPDERELTSVRSLLLTLIIVSLGSFVLNVLSKSFFAESILILFVPSCAFSMLIFYIGYDAYHRECIDAVFFDDINLHVCPDGCEKEQEQPLSGRESSDSIRQLSVRFEDIMCNEKLYLLSDLKVSDVTKRLGTNRDYLYRAITTCLNTSFADYVNRLRVEYSQVLLRDNPGMSMNDVMEKTGYTSESTFYRNFRKVTGVTPKQWLNNRTEG